MNISVTLTQEDLASEKVMQIENSVVKEIRAGHPVSRTSMSLQEALSRGDIVTIPCEVSFEKMLQFLEGRGLGNT